MIWDPYTWPWLGPVLQDWAADEGNRVAERLAGRGYDPAEILAYAQRGIIEGSTNHDSRRLYVYLGMAAAARRLMKDLEDLNAPLS